MHWTSGIEIGLRLISWTWIRRLLDDWPEVTDLFEHNELALRQIYWHQRYLAAFRSRGSSANNHVIAEAAGQLVGRLRVPVVQQERALAGRRGSPAREGTRRQHVPVRRRTASSRPTTTASSPSSACTPLLEADAAGHPLSPRTWALLTRIVDVAAAIVDDTLRPPRQGDDDEGMVLVLDPPDVHHWSAFLSLGGAVVGRPLVADRRRSRRPRSSSAPWSTASNPIGRPSGRHTSGTPG